mmetsp:Transcript_33004/g.60828  ORF Transcript_33004/g.60828 Transcript_33004/m.60828 type:complete len:215 (+) Transcript_33004:576-1220(+)
MFITTRCRIQKNFNASARLCDEGKFKVRRLRAMEGLIKNGLHRRLVILGDELFHETVPHHFFCRVTHKLHGTLVPDIDATHCIDAKDGGVCCVNQLGVFPLLSNATSNILANTNNADNFSVLITPGRCIQKHLDASTRLCDKREFKVGCLNTCEGLIENALDGCLIVLRDKFLDEAVPHHLSRGVSYQFTRALVPNIHSALGVDSKNGSIRRIN